MNPGPIVSVAMPVFNAEKTIEAAIRSILSQTFRDFELIIIDDGSTDSTLAIVKKLVDQRIRVIAGGAQRRLAFRLNQAIDMARGKYLARMDADDYSLPLRLERQVEFLNKNRDVDLAGTRAIMFDQNVNRIGLFPFRETHSEICRNPWGGFYFPHPTWMGRIEWFRKHRYNPGVLRSQDQDLLLRTYDSSRFACIPEILLGYRMDSIILRKSLEARWHFGRSIIREGLRRKNYGGILEGISIQVAKGSLDVLSVVFGFKKFLLRKKLTPSDPSLDGMWRIIRTQINE